MSGYAFVLDDIRFSYSSLSNFENCAYGFKLSYIDNEENEQNFYAQYGLLIHKVFEKYFNGELEQFELSSWYKNEYDRIVTLSPPPYPSGLESRYKEEGLLFFDYFSFGRDEYDVLMVEGSIEFEINGKIFIAKPDLVLKNKETGKTILFDYKTSVPFITNKSNGELKPDKKKFGGYYRQLYVYSHALKTVGINVDEITLWFPRIDKMVTVPYLEDDMFSAMQWLEYVVEKIYKEDIFDYGKPGEYFCKNLCGVRKHCKFG